MKRPGSVRLLQVASVGILAAWVLFLLLGRAISGRLSEAFGSVLARVGQGKFADANVFVYGRMREALFLFTAGFVLVTAGWWLGRIFKTKRFAWLFISGAWFIVLNLFVLAAMQTALFWALFWNGDFTNNYAQHQFKQVLLAETPRPRAILLGNSQTRAQIDENILNRELAGKLWTTELHFPGSRPCDLWLMIRQIQPKQGDVLVCYLSEGYFYTGATSECLPYFLNFNDLPGLIDFGGSIWWKQRNLYYGLLGSGLPLFRIRDPVAQRFLGFRMTQLNQVEHDESLAVNLDERAKDVALSLHDRDETVIAQKAAFHAFVRECKKYRINLVLCVGQLNPIVYDYAKPFYREDYLKFLDEVQKDNPQIVLLKPDILGWQTPDKYLDLTHVKKPGQHEFSMVLSRWLEQNLARLQPLGP
jgi:hypothetical protein